MTESKNSPRGVSASLWFTHCVHIPDSLAAPVYGLTQRRSSQFSFFLHFLVQVFHIGFLLATFCGLLHPHKFIPRNAPEKLHGSRRPMHSFAASNGPPVWFVDNQCRSWQSSTEAPSHCPNLWCRGPRDAVVTCARSSMAWCFCEAYQRFQDARPRSHTWPCMIFWEVSHTCNMSRMSRRMCDISSHGRVQVLEKGFCSHPGEMPTGGPWRFRTGRSLWKHIVGALVKSSIRGACMILRKPSTSFFGGDLSRVLSKRSLHDLLQVLVRRSACHSPDSLLAARKSSLRPGKGVLGQRARLLWHAGGRRLWPEPAWFTSCRTLPGGCSSCSIP